MNTAEPAGGANQETPGETLSVGVIAMSPQPCLRCSGKGLGFVLPLISAATMQTGSSTAEEPHATSETNRYFPSEKGQTDPQAVCRSYVPLNTEVDRDVQHLQHSRRL